MKEGVKEIQNDKDVEQENKEDVEKRGGTNKGVEKIFGWVNVTNNNDVKTTRRERTKSMR